MAVEVVNQLTVCRFLLHVYNAAEVSV